MDTTTRAKYSKLSEEKWRRVIAVLAASCVIQELCRLGLATCGSLPVQWRMRAVDVFQACEANPQAYPQPKGYKTWTARRKDIGQFIEKWWNRFGATGSTLDVPRPGRPRTVPDATLATLITHIKSVHYPNCEMYENDPPFQRVFMSYKICSKSLWRALQHYEPTLAKNYKVEHRPYLDTDKWDGRLDATAAWLRKLVNPNAPGVRMVSAEEALKYGVTDGAFPLPPEFGTADYESDAWLNRPVFDAFAMTDEKTFICNTTDSGKRLRLCPPRAMLRPRRHCRSTEPGGQGCQVHHEEGVCPIHRAHAGCVRGESRGAGSTADGCSCQCRG